MDYSMAGPFDPTLDQSEAWTSTANSNGLLIPRLYRNIFSLEHLYLLVFMGSVAFASPAFQLQDIVSMVIAQVWSGKAQLPPEL